MSMSMEKHVTILAILYIASGALFVFAACCVFIFVVSGGILSGDAGALALTSLVATSIAGFLVLLGIPGFIGGIGLVKHHNWARILILVLGFLNLINFPLGTFLGVYTIWVLMQDEADPYFAARPAA